MPKVKCQRATARGQPCREFCLQLLLSTYLLLLSLGQSQGAINIPKDYVIDDLKQPPVITFQTESYTVFYPFEVMLKCEAMGNPAPSYRWVKDGEIFREESFSSDPITANEDEDLKSYLGKYRCYASNELGTAMSDVIELITEPLPSLPREKRVRKNVKEGETVVLHCNVPETSVAPSIFWMDKKLQFISLSERVTAGLDGNLYFANTLVEDSRDDYNCHAQHIQTRMIIAMERISLTVYPSDQDLRQRPPQLHRLPGTHSHYLALRGQSLTLECIPHGLPTPTVVWEKKDGSLSATSAVSERFNRWLTFYSISENDDGEYSCTASNTLGKVTHSYAITVQAAPYWSKQPQSHRYAPGETVRLDCQAEGIPTPVITWRMNGVPIQEMNEEPRRRVSRGTLILNDVRYDDTAVYQCEASNQHETILINIYIHIIYLSPQILTSDKLLYNITEGDSASLDCVSFGSPRPQISWESENMETVLSDPRVSQLTNGTLRITDVRSEDAGAYSCSVKHFNLSIVAYLAVLKINHSEHPLLQFTSDSSPPSESNTTPAADLSPQILTSDKLLYNITEGDSASLDCVSFGSPRPQISWESENMETVLSDPRVSQLTNGTLRITDVRSEDAGAYSCSVKHFNLSIVAYLAVLKINHSEHPLLQFTSDSSPPSESNTTPAADLSPQILTSDKLLYNITEGDSASLDCVSFGSPRPQISWESENMETVLSDPRVSQLTNGTLRITDVRSEDAGEYSCSVKHFNLSIVAYLAVLKINHSEHPLLQFTSDSSPPSESNTTPAADLSPQILTSDKLLYNITEGDSASLDCVSFGSPWPQISWESENMETVLSDPRVSQLTNGTLRITDVRSEDAGAYSCSVKHFNLSIVAYLAVLKINHSEHPLLQFTSDSSPPSESNTTPAAGFSQGWFIGLVIASGLFILLIFCFIKCRKGGKHSAVQKRKDRADSLIKDETLAESTSV
ncbi:neural cell adhesion molecule L1-like [Hoplias malabaricus]|uniref:neural cell adhesion molecule L1-like n=1 Tax=Hoplias malabaricus TaxID=27720 RepID=UPI00346318AD